MSHFAIKSYCTALIAVKWLFFPPFKSLHLQELNEQKQHVPGEQRRLCPLAQTQRTEEEAQVELNPITVKSWTQRTRMELRIIKEQHHGIILAYRFE